ncbi:MAG: VWA domain-containing protein [Fibrobacter sp.]|nr:VWA domain-containing protein [Fibrobacter sp.]
MKLIRGIVFLLGLLCSFASAQGSSFPQATLVPDKKTQFTLEDFGVRDHEPFVRKQFLFVAPSDEWYTIYFYDDNPYTHVHVAFPYGYTGEQGHINEHQNFFSYTAKFSQQDSLYIDYLVDPVYQDISSFIFFEKTNPQKINPIEGFPKAYTLLEDGFVTDYFHRVNEIVFSFTPQESKVYTIHFFSENTNFPRISKKNPEHLDEIYSPFDSNVCDPFETECIYQDFFYAGETVFFAYETMEPNALLLEPIVVNYIDPDQDRFINITEQAKTYYAFNNSYTSEYKDLLFIFDPPSTDYFTILFEQQQDFFIEYSNQPDFSDSKILPCLKDYCQYTTLANEGNPLFFRAALINSTEASITASYKKLDEQTILYPITTEPHRYTLFNNYYGIDFTGGIYLQLDVPEDGFYKIHITNKKEDTFFVEGLSETVTVENGTYIFEGSFKAGDKATFHINVPETALITSFYEVYYQRLYSVTIDNDNNGSTTQVSSLFFEGDHIAIEAVPNADYIFSHWELVNGNCPIENSTLKNTQLIVHDDCNIKAHFKKKEIYYVTGFPVEYSVSSNFNRDSNPHEVAFIFAPQNSNDRQLVISRNSDVPFCVIASTNQHFQAPYLFQTCTSGNFTKNLSLERTPIYILVYNSNSVDDDEPFTIQYAGNVKLNVASNSSYGSVSPTTTTTLYGISNSIKASTTNTAEFKFFRWTGASEACIIEDSLNASTTIKQKSNCNITAIFSPTKILELSENPQTFSIKDELRHFSNDFIKNGSLFFSWTPTDDDWHTLEFQSNPLLQGTIYDLGEDPTFDTFEAEYPIKQNRPKPFKGGTKTHYWVLTNLNNESMDVSLWIGTTELSTLTIEPSKFGKTEPAGDTTTASGKSINIEAQPYAGYRFVRWNALEGFSLITDKRSAATEILIGKDSVKIEAIFEIDSQTIPELTINGIDSSNIPRLCIEFSLQDKNTQHSLSLINDDNIQLYFDDSNRDFQFSFSHIEDKSSVSVVLVVDESASMHGQKMTGVQKAIKEFINNMRLGDKTAIIGFSNTTRTLQSLTSDKQKLYAAVDNMKADGSGTYINTGAYAGIYEIQKEVNTPTVIIFSDGINYGKDLNTKQVFDFANQNNITIYSIAIDNAEEQPLKDLADSTGGKFVYSNDSDKLSEIYSNIQSEIQKNTYTACFESPDKIMNGEEHNIKVITSFDNFILTDSLVWAEPHLVDKDRVDDIQITNESGSRIFKRTDAAINTNVSSQEKIFDDKKLPIKFYCINSGDEEASYVRAYKYGTYFSEAPFPKNERSPVLFDGTLSCAARDTIVAEYIDPIYQTVTYDSVAFSDNIPITYQFLNITDNSKIDSIENRFDTEFKVVITAESPSIYDVDILKLLLFTDSGDSIYVDATETGVYTSTFEANVKFAIVRDNSEVIENRLEAIAKPGSTSSRVKIQAQVENDQSALIDRDSLILTAGYTPAKISISDADSGNEEILRTTKLLDVSISSGNFSDNADVISATIYCQASQDSEIVSLEEIANGNYTLLNPLSKDESTNILPGDGKLSCRAKDSLIIEYVDPFFKILTRESRAIEDNTVNTYKFLVTDTKDALDSTETSLEADFDILVTANSPSLDKMDTINILLFTDAGDSLFVKAVETGVYTSTFIAKGFFTFVNDQKQLRSDILDGLLDNKKNLNRVKIYAQADNDKSSLSLRDSLIIRSTYVPMTITVHSKDSINKVTRITESFSYSVSGKDFSTGVDSIRMELTCLNSNDFEEFTLVETEGGIFNMTSDIIKDERKPVHHNGNLSCAASDTIVAKFTDLFYKISTSDTIIFADVVQNKYTFLDTSFLAEIDSIEGYSAPFAFQVSAVSPTLYDIDTIKVLLFTDAGDSLFVKAVETGVYTSTFIAKGFFTFVNDQKQLRSDILDGLLDNKKNLNRVKIYAQADNDKSSLSLRDSLIIRSTYVPMTITVHSKDSINKVTRITESFSYSVSGKDFSTGVDSIRMELTCLNSNDFEEFTLVETEGGIFNMTSDIIKDERKPVHHNGNLSCAASDTIVAKFTDLFYKISTSDTIIFADVVQNKYTFLDTSFLAEIDSIEGYSAPFAFQVSAVSPTLYDIDTIKVLLFTDAGDSLFVKAVETGPYTSTFNGLGEFFFVTESKNRNKSVLDASLNLDSDVNRIRISLQVGNDTSSVSTRDSLIVYTSFIPADIAEIYDRDKDGRADSIRIHFIKSIENESIFIDSVFWNSENVNKVIASKTHLTGDATWIEAILENPFEYGHTTNRNGKKNQVKISRSSSSLTQEITLTDKVGAVPISAIKHPGLIDSTDYLSGESPIVPDTLFVEMSEPIDLKKASSFKDMFRFSKNCESSDARKLYLLSEPKTDSSGTKWTLILNPKIDITTGNCLRTSPDTSFQDRYGNLNGIGGIEITGTDGTSYIYEIEATPSVSGLGKKVPWISDTRNEWEDIPDSVSCIRTETRMPYTASITILDALGHFIISFKQKFGYNGEMENPIHHNKKIDTRTGFLSWNQRTADDRKVGSGIYIWKINFTFADGHKETRSIRTGIRRRQ